MNRRSFLRFLGLGAAVAAVPAVANARQKVVVSPSTVASDPGGLAYDEMGQWEGFRFVGVDMGRPDGDETTVLITEHGEQPYFFRTQRMSLEEAKEMFPGAFDVPDSFYLPVHPNSWLGQHWSEQQQAQMTLNKRATIEFNRIKLRS